MRLPWSRSEPRPVRLVQADVMGRSAIAVVLIALQPSAVLQLLDQAAGSENLDRLGIPHLADAWAITMLLGGLLMLSSYVFRQDDDTRVLEIAACGLIAIVATVHVLAVLKAIGYSGASYTTALDLSLIVNCGGRAVFLGRQMWWVHRGQGL